MPRPATGKTPVRNTRIRDAVWLPALAKAEAQALTGTDAVDKGLRLYTREPFPAAWEFELVNWPEAAEWARGREDAINALGRSLSTRTGAVTGEWLTVSAYLAVDRHPNDAEQQRRILAGHVLRVITASDHWTAKFKTDQDLLAAVLAVIAEHLPLDS